MTLFTRNAMSDNLGAELIHILRDNQYTLSAAESCTGGLIADSITNTPGSGDVFMAGVIAYSAFAKKELLGVPSQIIDRFGVVSDETARAMAEGIRGRMQTSYAVSTTGNLGPTTLEDKPSGLVYIAVSSQCGVYSRKLLCTADRRRNKEYAAAAALAFLKQVMMKEFLDAKAAN